MTFFNPKEDVLDIKLTQYGKWRLSQGELSPSYYLFFDDDILYDANCAGPAVRATATITCADGDLATSGQFTEGEYVQLINAVGEKRVYVLVDESETVSPSLATGDVIDEGVDIGAAAISSDVTDLGTCIAVVCNLNTDTQAEILNTFSHAITGTATHATAPNCIDTTGVEASSADASFTILITTAAGGEHDSTAVTILLDDSATTDPAQTANTIAIGTAGISDAAKAAALIDAINGVSSSLVDLADSGVGQAGVQGVTAAQGSSDTQITLTMDAAGVAGNLTNAITTASGVDIVDVRSFTGGSSFGWYGHVGTITTSADLTAADGEQVMTLTQHAPYGAHGNMPVTTNISQFTVTDFTGGSLPTIAESQNYTEGRIQEETPKLRTQYSFRESSGNIISDSTPSTIEKHFSLENALGTSNMTSGSFPRWDMRMFGEDGPVITKSTEYMTSSFGTSRIPQIDVTANFRTAIHSTNGSKVIKEDINLSSPVQDDGTYVAVQPRTLLMQMIEENTAFEKENFDIEVYIKDTETIFSGPEEIEIDDWTPLSFKKKVTNIVDGILLDEQPEICHELDPTYVEYYFDIFVDDDIVDTARSQITEDLNTQSMYLPPSVNQSTDAQFEIADIYSQVVPDDPCPDDKCP